MTSVFFATPNLTLQSMTQVLPWEFRPAELPSDEVRHNKKARQEFYKNPSTVWQYYTGIEGINPGQRVSKSNPPHKIHAIIVDVDLPLDAERIAAAINAMKLKPAYVERSLGANVRCVWILSRPILVNTLDFSTFILQQSRAWLQLDLLAGIDAKALEDSTRLYCQGAEWQATGAGPIPENAVQAFFVETGSKYLFKDTGSVAIPLDVVEVELKRRFPLFSWPGLFELNSQGPSFWIADSASAASAILKADGFFTFSAHAAKPFYSFADILGSEFVKDFQTNSIALATSQVYWDGRLYWVMSETDGRFVSLPKEALTTRLRVRARVSTKSGKDGLSMLDKCLDFIHEFGRVEGGAPILHRPLGLIIENGTRLVNTAPKTQLVRPSGDERGAQWGAKGGFPFVSSVLENLFDPVEQLEPFRAWAAYFYKHAHAGTPSPGQNIFLLGGAGAGKTLTSRFIIGGVMGSFCDASKYLLGSCAFNSSLFSSSCWVCDDENFLSNDSAHRVFQSYIKSCAANQDFRYSKKFESDLTVSWQGRIIVTANADEASARCLPALDGSILDKVSFFRVVSEPRIKFPEREEIKKLLVAELPNFAQFLLNYETPAAWRGDSRFGVRSHHEESLLSRASHAGKSSPFKEILLQYLSQWFKDNPDAQEYRASVTQLVRGLHSDFLNESVMRSLKLEQINRYLEIISKEGTLSIRSESGPRKTRLWIVERFQ